MLNDTCTHCGESSTTKYCSSKCKSAARYVELKKDPEKYEARLAAIRETAKRRRQRLRAKEPKRLTCKCGTEFEQGHSRQVYCSPDCRQPSHPKMLETCDACGKQCLKDRRPERRYLGVYCSLLCRDYKTYGTPTTCRIPKDHWARWFGTTSTWIAPLIRNTGECGWCGSDNNRAMSASFCSYACKSRAKRARRRAAEHNAPGEYTFTQVMRQYLKQGGVCAYCKTQCVGLPDPEHVIPLSRGGRNDMSNIVAACRPCNADKRDLLLDEWNEDRKRRGLRPVRTNLENLSEFFHLAA